MRTKCLLYIAVEVVEHTPVQSHISTPVFLCSTGLMFVLLLYICLFDLHPKLCNKRCIHLSNCSINCHVMIKLAVMN